MILRFLMLLVGAIFGSMTTSYVYGRNQFAELYAPEADSISIPILFTQFILMLVIVILIPSILLGNKRLKNWLKDGSKARFIIFSIVLAISYTIAGLFELLLVSGGLDKNHWEISASMILLIGVTAFFMASDIKWALSKKTNL